MTKLIDALNARFTDINEIEDVANHGCSAGVSGFIYYTETSEFFNQHETDIQLFLADYDYCLADFCKDPGATIATAINNMVCAVVEIYCQDRLDNN